VSAWIDGSPIYPTPSTGYNLANWPGGVVFPSLTDDAEKGIASIFSKRHTQLATRLSNQAFCSPTKCPSAQIDRCIREIVILELRSIASEFLTEALNLPLSKKVAFPSNANVVPVELAAAHVFDYHWLASSSQCNSLTGSSDATALGSCITNALSTSLPTQMDLSSVSNLAINQTSQNIKMFGLGNLNSYLFALGSTEINYGTADDNILVNLHGSDAEYAINFGILADILSRDSVASVASANATCHGNLVFTGTDIPNWETFLNSVIPPAPSRTMCTMLQDMAQSPAVFTSPTFLQKYMFRGGSGGTTCT